MRLRKIIALLSGLGAFAAAITLVILIVNNQSPIFIALFCITAAILAAMAFELFHYAFNSSDKGYRFFSRGGRGWIFDLAFMSLGIGLTVGSVVYQRPSDPFCRGLLSAGFPAAFICDASGESPLSSVGKIDWADTDNINLLGSFVDILFYIALMWVAWAIVRRISQEVRQRIQYQ